MTTLRRAALALAVAFALSTGGSARADEKLLGVVVRIAIAADGRSAVATLKDRRSAEDVDVAIEDEGTLRKLVERRIEVGDAIRCRYERRGGKKVATSFKKAGGCTTRAPGEEQGVPRRTAVAPPDGGLRVDAAAAVG